MVSLVRNECPCCTKISRTQDFRDLWHCEYCWNKYHNGIRDKDWQDEKTWQQNIKI